MAYNVIYFRLKEAIEKNSAECFLCSLESQAEQRYLNNYLQELVMDSKARETIIHSRGFCNNHSYQLLNTALKPASSDGHAVALIMRSIIESVIDEFPKKGEGKYNFFKMLTNPGKCPACCHIEENMKRYVSEVIDLIINSEEFFRSYKESRGVCMPHFATLISATQELEPNEAKKILEILYAVEWKTLLQIQSGLSEYISRQSYEFSERERAEKAGVLLRSIKTNVGRRGLVLKGKLPNEP
jgi:hypothetical protein